MNKNNILAIWGFNNKLPLKKISLKEERFTREMSDSRAYQFIHSRGYARYALSKIFNIEPLEIPLNAKPKQSPVLPLDYGYISISHCTDMLLVAWSMQKLGVDIERSDRKIVYLNYFKKLFTDELKSENLRISDNEALRSKILDFWVLKESLVKWEKNSIFTGLKNWKFSKNCNYGYNKSGFKVRIQNIEINDWKIGLASNHHRNFYPLQVCF